MSEYKTSLADIQAGDQVVWHASDYGVYGDYRLLTVTKVTPKQIVVGDNRRYWRENGKEVGAGSSYHWTYLYPPGKVWGGQGKTYVQLAQHCEASNDVRDLLRQLERIGSDGRRSKTTEQLQQAADLLRQALEILK